MSGRKVVLHQIPSGVLNQNARCVIGPAVVLDPETLIEEMTTLCAAGHDLHPGRLAISGAANLVLPYHKALDRLREQAAGTDRIGTTGRGIGPAYEDMVARRGVRAADLCDANRLRSRLSSLLPERNALIRHLGGEPWSPDDLMDLLLPLGRTLAPYLQDTGAVLASALADGRRVLFESAQGTLLDVLHGTYPYVTSSLTSAMAAFPLSGIGMPPDTRVLGVMKAYTTRVGGGPFPTEDSGEFGVHLRTRGAEYGATTGRPRRCGALDLPALRYAIRVNGATHLAVMKLDVLGGLERIPVCTSYQAGGHALDVIHPSRFSDPDLRPVFEESQGWFEDLRTVRGESDLPPAARGYLRRIEEALGVPVSLVSLGSDREDTLFRTDPWP